MASMLRACGACELRSYPSNWTVGDKYGIGMVSHQCEVMNVL